MKKIFVLFSLILLLIVVGCKKSQVTTEETTTTEPTTTTEDEPQFVISDPSETKDSFSKEPMNTKLEPIDGIKVVFQYDQPVPSFDTWETKEEPRNHFSLNGDWYFRTDPENVGVKEKWYSPYYDFTSWELRPVPSSWDTYDNGLNKPWGVGYAFYDGYAWYNRTFELDETWQDQYIKINFLGVNYRSWIYINGKLIGAHESGNTAFSLDITDYVRKGTNYISVRVYRRPDFEDYTVGEGNFKDVIDNNSIPAGHVDYWPYAGITRDVYLEGTNKLTVSKILTNPNIQNRTLEMYAVIYNTDTVVRSAKLAYDPGQNTGGTVQTVDITVQPGETRVYKATLSVPDTKLWSYVSPNLYTGYVRLLDEENNKLDELHVDYGMRQFTVQGSSIYLNGQEVFLKGTCWHEETLKSGRSLRKDEYDFELSLVKGMNMNFIRNSHYNRHPYVYEWADREGIMVMDETENMWLGRQAIYNQYRNYRLSYAAVLMTTWNQINHPSVIIWSLSNEVSYDGVYSSWIKELYDATKAVDIQKRPVSWAAVNTDDPAFALADIIGFNEYAGFFWGINEDLTGVLEGVHNRFPNKPLLITENGSWSVLGNVGYPGSGGGTEHWQADNAESHYKQAVAKKDYVVGYTFWVLKDYKTRNGYNTQSQAISTMGVVPFYYSQETYENASSMGVDIRKVVYYRFRSLKNPYTYVPEE